MPGILLSLLLPVAMAGLWPVFGSDPLEETFPIEARGDIHFQADAARFREGSDTVLELALTIPRDALGQPDDSAHVRAEVTLLDKRGEDLAAYSTEIRFPPSEPGVRSRFPVPHSWIRLTPTWTPGTAAVRVRIDDLTRRKRGLLDRMRDKPTTGEVAALIGGEENRDLLSDILFVWGAAESSDAGGPQSGSTGPEPGSTDLQSGSTGPRSGSTGLRGVRARLEPNPFRYYGRYQPVLTVYWEQYPPEAATGPLPGTRLLSRTRILEDTLEVHRGEEEWIVRSEPHWALRRFDLSELPSGSYRFEVTLHDPGAPDSEPLARSAGTFQLIWDKRSWALDMSDVLAVGRVLLPGPQFAEFSELDRGGQENFLREFWNRYAPTPPSQENPLERTFYERAQHASRHFPGQRAGILSDRCRVYVRFGPPDEIRAQLNPQDSELLWLQMPKEIADAGVDDDERARRLSRRRSRQDNRAYEIWEYNVRGEPLIPEYLSAGHGSGLKFVFVDELGIGEYTLAYSSAVGALY